MTRYAVFVATLVAIAIYRRRGLEAAYLYAWIPFFLAMPFDFWVNIPGLPDPNFMQAAILPLLFFLVRERGAELRFGMMEFLIVAYVAIKSYCDFLGRGYSDAQNYAFYMISSLVGSYLLGRYVISSRRMDIETSRMFVLIFLLFFPLFLFEFKFWVSPIFKIVSPLFPNAMSGLSIRWGLARTHGTFEHPILACIMIIITYRLHRWLTWIGFWDQPQTGVLAWIQKQSKRVPIAFKYQISIVLILMALMTISRGPWIGGIVGAALVAVGNMKNRKRWLFIFTFGLVVGGITGQLALDAYITPKEGEVLTGEAQTMLYRKVMIDKYKAFLMEKFWTGWGLTTVPKIQGMESVDNAFFLMALQHGVLAPAVMVMMLLYAIVTQIMHGLKAPPGEPPIGFTFSGIYLMCFVAFSTVYMGAQTEPMLFLLIGWGESIKNRREESLAPVAGAEAGPARAPTAPFRRVLS